MKKSIYDKPWVVYIAQCSDTTFYTGVAKDVAKRIRAHNTTSQCRYTRARKPVTLIYQEMCSDHAAARKREAAIKRLDREEKLAVIGGKNRTR
ncbi:MAG: GIY-YIG nuclease family protein [Candidatus Omnitrophota bacterium]